MVGKLPDSVSPISRPNVEGNSPFELHRRRDPVEIHIPSNPSSDIALIASLE
jgi:hypothetical protein